jgi:hypothetical protein
MVALQGVSFDSMPKKNILALLGGGDRRSIGRADQVVQMVSKNQALFAELMNGLCSQEPLIRMRAADAAEKITRTHPDWVNRYKRKLLELMGETQQQELRWHLAAIVPRLQLNSQERQLVVSSLKSYLDDHSSIVKTSALQALVDLTPDDASIRPEVIKILRKAAQAGTPAMKARSRKLLVRLERV